MNYKTIVTDSTELCKVIDDEIENGWCVDYIYAEPHDSLRIVTFASKVDE